MAGDARPKVVSMSGRRLRRRGPRSSEAKARRLRPPPGSPPDGACGKSRALPSVSPSTTTIACVNVCHLQNKIAELCARLEQLRADIVVLTETWLDQSRENVIVPGYEFAARLDRSGRAGGGVAVLVREGTANVVHVANSSNSERFWLLLTSDIRPLLIGACRRPPDDGMRSIASLEDELEEHGRDAIGVLLLGDMNIHHRKWLVHSAWNTAEGEALQDMCARQGLQQLVRGPTREEHLLDLVISDLGNLVSVTVCPKLADHSVVVAKLAIKTDRPSTFEREVWQFEKADWQRLMADLTGVD